MEEEAILSTGSQLSGSMIGRRRILSTWAVGEAWERFSNSHASVVQRAFTAVGLTLPIDGSQDSEISIKGLETSLFIDGLRDWEEGGVVGAGIIEDEGGGESEGEVELDIAEDELDGEYLVGEVN